MADSKKTKCIKFKEYSLNIVRQPSLGDKKIKTLNKNSSFRGIVSYRNEFYLSES